MPTFEEFFLAWVEDDGHFPDRFDNHFYDTFVTPWSRPGYGEYYPELWDHLTRLAVRFGFESVDEAFQSLEPRAKPDPDDTVPDGEPTEPNDSRFPDIGPLADPSQTITLA